jgi:hypothetical protein
MRSGMALIPAVIGDLQERVPPVHISLMLLSINRLHLYRYTKETQIY